MNMINNYNLFKTFSLLILLISTVGFPRSIKPLNDYVYTNFTTKDGLPSNEVYCVFQDSKGYIWIGTDRGVAKYDGYEFKTYTTEDGLTDNVIFGIAEDQDGQVWFTTSNKSLCYYSNENEFKAFKYNDLIIESILKEGGYYMTYLDQIYVNSKNELYLSNFQSGYLKINLNQLPDFENNIFKIREYKTIDFHCNLVVREGYSNVFFNPCLQSAEGAINLDVNGGFKSEIWVQKESLNRTYLLNDSTFALGNTIYSISDSNVNSVSYNYPMHIFKVNGGFVVNTIESNRKGRVFFTRDIYNLSNMQPILNKSIRLTPSVRDKNGGIWLGSLEQGVFYIPELTDNIVQANTNVQNLFPYYQGIVMGERGQNFKHIIKNEIIDINTNLPINGLFNHKELSLKFTHPAKFKNILNLFSEYGIGKANMVSNIVKDKKQLFFNCKQDLYLHNTEVKSSFRGLSFDNFIHSLTQDNKGFLYVGLQNQIYKINKNKFKSSNSLYTNIEEEPYISINARPQDLKWFPKQDILVVATTGRGLMFYKEDRLIRSLTTKDGLVSNTINQLHLDSEDRLWVGTNKGINYIEIDDKNSIVVNSYLASSKSLLSPNIQQIYVLEDSLLYLGTDRGLSVFNLSSLNERDENNYFPVYITDVFVNKKPFKSAQLNYEDNNIEFQFTAIEFNKYGKINYRYRLNGLSKEWIYTSERKATFLQLNPGKYGFELEAQNEKGNWVKAEKVILFTIRKPYWKTWWFIGGICVVIVLVIGGAFYYYVSNLTKEKSLIEDKQVLSEELNETRQKALSAQLNPHFVFNSLNSIQNFILTKRTELSSDYLSTFSKLMRFVFENSKKLYVSLFDEIEALKLYLELEQVRHNHKFKYKISVVDIDVKDIFLPSLLVQPIIENAIWHGLLHKKDGDCLLEVNFTMVEEYLQIEIKDNGVGRSASIPRPKIIKKQRSSGVELTKQRLDLLSQSTESKTKFEIVDLFNEFNEPSGTIVIISIPNNL